MAVLTAACALFNLQQDSIDSERDVLRRRGQRSPSPYTHIHDEGEPGLLLQRTHHFQQPHYDSGLAVGRMSRSDRRMAAVQPPSLNAYQRAQIERQQQEQHRRLMENERSRLVPLRQAEEDEARQEFLSRRRRSPTFALDPPPHLIQPTAQLRHAPHQLLPSRTDSTLPAYSALIPVRPAGLYVVHSAQQRHDPRGAGSTQ